MPGLPTIVMASPLHIATPHAPTIAMSSPTPSGGTSALTPMQVDALHTAASAPLRHQTAHRDRGPP